MFFISFYYILITGLSALFELKTLPGFLRNPAALLKSNHLVL